jgi:ketosteroid isomerase-like protein
LNRRDLDWLVAHCDPGVEMHMRGDVEARTACTYRLRDGALTELRSYRDAAEGLAASGLDP